MHAGMHDGEPASAFSCPSNTHLRPASAPLVAPMPSLDFITPPAGGFAASNSDPLDATADDRAGKAAAMQHSCRRSMALPIPEIPEMPYVGQVSAS
jgi:hypothetical protein